MECGDCTACCTICGIGAVNAPRGVKCQHADKGCKIYENRPKECEGFDCFYSGQPDLPEFLRPDNLGAMLEMPYGSKNYHAFRVPETKLNVKEFLRLEEKLKDIGIEVILENGST